MITAEAAGLAIKIANGLIKLTNRLDLILAEQAAVEGPLALVQPEMVLAPTPEQMIPALRKLLDETEPGEGAPDPLGIDRAEIAELVAAGEAGEDVDQEDLLFWMERHLPEQALGKTLNLTSKVMKAVRKARPHWDLNDPSIRATAFYVSPGVDPEKKGYAWRIALTVVDVLAEFGAENTALFTRDAKVQGIVRSILQRFGEADLQTADSWEGVLRKVLSATLNGALDATEFYDVDDEWLEALFEALHGARDSVPEGKRDQFLLGLFEGRGYERLVGSLLETAAGRLNAEDGEVFEAIAVDVLQAAAAHFQKGGSFKQFLTDNWGDVLRAGLSSLAEHGSVLLADQSPLVQTVVAGVIDRLAKTPNHKLLTTDTLVGLIDAAVRAVAAKPELLSDAIDEDWLELLVRSVTGSIATQGIAKTFSGAGLQQILGGTLEAFAEHPELIIRRPGLPQELLRGVLSNLSGLDRLTAESLGVAVLEAGLETLAKRPDLLEFEYSELVSELAGKVGKLVSAGSLTRIQGADVLRAVVETLVENPAVFLKTEKKLAGIIVDAVLEASQGDHGLLLAGATLVQVARSSVAALAGSANAALANLPLADLVAELQAVLDAGLARAEHELGNRLVLSALPTVLGDLIRTWARGELGVIDPENQNFKRLFSQLADRAAA